LGGVLAFLDFTGLVSVPAEVVVVVVLAAVVVMIPASFAFRFLDANGGGAGLS
jgi:hypothetical protein